MMGYYFISHNQFKSMGIEYIKKLSKNYVLFDIKSLFKKKFSDLKF